MTKETDLEGGKVEYNLLGYKINGKQNGILTSVERDESFPQKFTLSQNYPNPFNPTTTIKYSIPSVGTARELSVQLKVYDILGREIATLVNKKQSPGRYAVDFNASSLSTGIYYYRLKASNFIQTKKMILLK